MDNKLIASFRRFASPGLLSEAKWRFGSHFDGDYASWAEAKKRCAGNGSRRNLPRVLKATRAVVSGSAVAEKNGVELDHIEYSWPALAGLLWVASQESRLRVVDLGGSLGTVYRQNGRFLRAIRDLNWAVVEEPDFVLAGKREFEDGRLQFFHELESAFTAIQANSVLLSNALQYLEKPYEMLNRIFKLGARYLLLDRTPLIEGKVDRLTVRTLPKQARLASYPAWFFSRTRLLSHLEERYQLVERFDLPVRTNISSQFMGGIWKRK